MRMTIANNYRWDFYHLVNTFFLISNHFSLIWLSKIMTNVKCYTWAHLILLKYRKLPTNLNSYITCHNDMFKSLKSSIVIGNKEDQNNISKPNFKKQGHLKSRDYFLNNGHANNNNNNTIMIIIIITRHFRKYLAVLPLSYCKQISSATLMPKLQHPSRMIQTLRL